MRKKYYSEEGSEHVYDRQFWMGEAQDLEKGFIVVEKMKREIGGEAWCKEEGDFVERGCFEGCSAYTPRNGKSGRCRWSVPGFIGTGIKVRITNGGQVRRAPN